MKKKSKLIILFSLVFAISAITISCEKAPTLLFEDDFTAFKLTNHASIHKGGEIVYEFNEERHQIVYTTDRRLYMVTNMEQTEFYSLIIPTTPRLYKTINVKMKSIGIEALKPEIHTMEMVQEKDGKIWLWDKNSSVGFVLDFI